MFSQLSPSSDEEVVMHQLISGPPRAPAYRHYNKGPNKGHVWTADEHSAFVAGLNKLGRGNWRDISRWFVPSRTPTQVASHAQKHFMRLNGVSKRRSRFNTDSDTRAISAPLSPAQPHDSPSESNSPASTTMTTTSSGAAPLSAAASAAAAVTTAATVPPASARPVPSPPMSSAPAVAATCPPSSVPCGATGAAAAAATASAGCGGVPGRKVGVPVFLPGPGGAPMMLTFPPGCCTPVVTPCAALAWGHRGGSGVPMFDPTGCGIWPSPFMLHAMAAVQQHHQAMLAAGEAAAAAAPAAAAPSAVHTPALCGEASGVGGRA